MNINACLSHNTDNWKTPHILYDYFINNLKCVELFEYCSSQDQYEKKYYKQKLFINPPYSHLRTFKFRLYLLDLISDDNIVYLLIPVRTDTKLFNFIFEYIDNIVFFQGRLHFNDSKKCAPFPTMILKLKRCRFFARDIFHYTIDELIRFHYE